MNVFWLDPDTEKIKADRVTPGARGRPRDGFGDPDRPDGRHQLRRSSRARSTASACGWSGSSRSTTARTRSSRRCPRCCRAASTSCSPPAASARRTTTARSPAWRSVAGVELVLDEPTLRADRRDRGGVRARPRRRSRAGFERGNRKQATVPAGAEVLPPVGTAPGVIMPVGDQRIVVLPGPPVELSRMWPAAVASPLVAPLLAGGLPRKVLRMYGVPESTIADAFEDLGGDAGGTETTICASRAEIEVVIRHPEAAGRRADRPGGRPARAVRRARSSPRAPATLEAIVLDALRGRGAHAGDGRELHRRPRRRPAGRRAGRVRRAARRHRRLRQRGQAGAARRAGRAARRARLRLARGGAGDGRGRASRHGRRRGRLGDRRRRPGRRHGGQAGRPGLPARGRPTASTRPLERRFPGPRENVRDWSATAALHLVRIVAQQS